MKIAKELSVTFLHFTVLFFTSTVFTIFVLVLQLKKNRKKHETTFAFSAGGRCFDTTTKSSELVKPRRSESHFNQQIFPSLLLCLPVYRILIPEQTLLNFASLWPVSRFSIFALCLIFLYSWFSKFFYEVRTILGTSDFLVSSDFN
ncbi:T24P13.21 [Arabidopsis thaliana]|uniref:T24P13.21 n=1 Tax=Arabidopsis thaliana TaxID=3702 RepID=Q9LQX0_ARATH|nr:T24P13.21 [Arabidopsis thaliana]